MCLYSLTLYGLSAEKPEVIILNSLARRLHSAQLLVYSTQILHGHDPHANLHVVMTVPGSPYSLSLVCDPSARRSAK